MGLTLVSNGPYSWKMQRDSEGHRIYTVVYRVKGLTTDGPANVIRTPGLPTPGEIWAIYDDLDIWAWCRPETEVTPELEGEPNQFWKVTCTFSTKPLERSSSRCNDTQIEDPLLEPAKISGGLEKHKEVATKDRWGNPPKNSAHQVLKGSKMEFNRSNPTITIEQNVLVLDLPLLAYMKDRVNDRPMWGMPRRCILITDITWERKFYATCYQYFTRRITFEADVKGFDRDFVDEGTRVLSGEWKKENQIADDPSSAIIVGWTLKNLKGTIVPDKDNPSHFIGATDIEGKPANIILDGNGQPFLPADILTCSECPVVPRYYTISGLSLGDIVVNYISGGSPTGCYWNKIDNIGPVNFRLELKIKQPDEEPFIFGQSDPLWVVILDLESPGSPAPGGVEIWAWSLGTGSFDCRKNNIFNGDRVTPALTDYTFPAELKVSPSTAGTIHVEKYDNGNFLLLGLPPYLGIEYHPPIGPTNLPPG